MRFPRNAKIFRGQLDIAPFAGVFFLLVIFILLSSSFVFTPGVRIDLPRVESPLPGATNESLVVALDSAGRLYFDSQVTTEEKLADQLKTTVLQSTPGVVLQILADRNVRMEKVIRVMDLAKRAGIAETWVATQPNRFLTETNVPPAQ